MDSTGQPPDIIMHCVMAHVFDSRYICEPYDTTYYRLSVVMMEYCVEPKHSASVLLALNIRLRGLLGCETIRGCS